MKQHPLWKDSRPADLAWRAPVGLTIADRAAEQDAAGGGRLARQIALPDGRHALPSVALRVLPKGRRVYAYLRWADGGRTHEHYIGEVSQDNRPANLAEAWDKARHAGLRQRSHSTTDHG